MDPDIAMTPIVLDIETSGLPNAADYLEPIPDAVPDESPIEADKRLTDPSKIAADLERKRAARHEANLEAQAKVELKRADRLARASLDPNVGRIVAIGWWTHEHGTETWVCSTEFEEGEAIRAFWKTMKHRPIIGFACKHFDLRFLIQRSRYLRIPYPWVDLNKYASKGVIDLYLELTFFDPYGEGAMKRTLKAFCARFGIVVEDPIEGKDIADLVLMGEWDQVEAHCAADVERTRRLAERLNYLRPVPTPVQPDAELVL